MKTSIALIGFMGTGKTAVGRALARRLGKEFVELDALIESRAGRKIAAIFREEGETRFRELEIEAVKEAAGRKNTVIACGGGVVLNWINIERLKKECRVVYLTASTEVILKRLSGDEGERPLMAVPDRAAQIRALGRFRRPFYERAGDIKIATSKMSVDAVVEKIIARLKDYEAEN
jgi:shikimate kinase